MVKKILLIGDAKVGKTSLAVRLRDFSIPERLQPTLDISQYNFILKGEYFHLIDTCGTSDNRFYTSLLLNCDYLIFMYSIKDKSSLYKLKNIWNHLYRNWPCASKIKEILVLANLKVSDPSSNQLTTHQGLEFSKAIGAQFLCIDPYRNLNITKLEKILLKEDRNNCLCF